MISKIMIGGIILLVSVIVGSVLALSCIADMIEMTTPVKVETKHDYRKTKLKSTDSSVVPLNGDAWDIQPALGYRVLQPTENSQRGQ